jgi:hypothetical protein
VSIGRFFRSKTKYVIRVAILKCADIYIGLYGFLCMVDRFSYCPPVPTNIPSSFTVSSIVDAEKAISIVVFGDINKFKQTAEKY